MKSTNRPCLVPLRRIARSASALGFALCAGASGAQGLPAECGNLSRPWGPFDYRADRYIPEPTYRSHAALLAIVENAHFTSEVESLIRGKTGAPPAGDIGYTLGVFPNHHRALIAMVKLGEKTKTAQPTASHYTVECWLMRGVVWRPDDPIVRLIYSNYLMRAKRIDDAARQLQAAAAIAKDNPFTLNNIGLSYFDLQRYDEALAFAHKAMRQGFNPVQLREKLEQAGKWAAPSDEAPAEAASPASAASAP